MIRKILLLFTMLVMIVYLAVAITVLNDKPANQVCRKVELIIKDSIHSGLVSTEEITDLLKRKGLYPVGKKTASVISKVLERELKTHPLIENAECYKTLQGNICLEITQRLSVLRIMSENGENYYIDSKGTIIPAHFNCLAHLAIVTGNAEKSFVRKDLCKFGIFLQKDKFWKAQIEQIHVTPQKEIELIPRVGDHIVFLGKIDNFEEKLAKLKIFYAKALNQVGWNKYSKISLEFNNQIICTKKEK